MIGEFIREALGELFIIFDDLIITAVIVAVIGIVYFIIKSEYEHKEYIKKEMKKRNVG